jgi:hypothetical protein
MDTESEVVKEGAGLWVFMHTASINRAHYVVQEKVGPAADIWIEQAR